MANLRNLVQFMCLGTLLGALVACETDDGPDSEVHDAATDATSSPDASRCVTGFARFRDDAGADATSSDGGSDAGTSSTWRCTTPLKSGQACCGSDSPTPCSAGTACDAFCKECN